MFNVLPSLLPSTHRLVGGARGWEWEWRLIVMCISLMLAREVVTISTCSGTRVQVSHMTIMWQSPVMSHHTPQGDEGYSRGWSAYPESSLPLWRREVRNIHSAIQKCMVVVCLRVQCDWDSILRDEVRTRTGSEESSIAWNGTQPEKGQPTQHISS